MLLTKINIYQIFNKNIFPACVAVNLFSMTLFLILLSFVGESEMAADVGIVQAATLAVFMAFSANARNLILSSSSDDVIRQQFSFRLLMAIPLSMAAYLISMLFVKASGYIVALLILRRCSEWLAELQISEQEKYDYRKFGSRFITIQIFSFLVLLFSLENTTYFGIGLLVWSVSPIIQILPFIMRMFNANGGLYERGYAAFLPHLGSSWIIAISVYIFRVIIVLLTGHSVAGIAFSAYALGGIFNSLYTYAFGPSLVMKNAAMRVVPKVNLLLMVSIIGMGVILAIISYLPILDNIDTQFFIRCIGFSLIGSGIMIVAQQKRIYILQIKKENVFVSDVLANLLIIATLPFALYIIGNDVLPFLFLWSSIIAIIFYSFSSTDSYFYTWRVKKIFCGIDNFYLIQAGILFLVFFPLFFQLNGGIFAAPDMVFDSFGSLTRVPLPIASIFCFLGLALLLDMRRARIATTVVFVFFTSMLTATVLLAVISGHKQEINKLTLMLQYIIPVFALMLGQFYEAPKIKMLRFEAIMLYVLAIIVPAEVIATIINQSDLLSPSLYIFSLYQHLQYMPVIFVGGFVVSLLSLYQVKYMQGLLLLISPFMGAYVALSQSMTAMLMLAAGVGVFSFITFRKRKLYLFSFMLTVLLLGSFFLQASSIYSKNYFQGKFDVIVSAEVEDTGVYVAKAPQEIRLPQNFLDRFREWKIYSTGIMESPQSFFLGHMERPDRSVTVSAHNYYLDLLYNYGFIGLLPLLYLIYYTALKLYKMYRIKKMNFDVTVLASIVFFYIVIDNSVKVGFRQPYPGIIMFFMWGVLLNRLRVNMSDLKTLV